MAPSLEDIVEAGVELGRHVEEQSNVDVVVKWVSEARVARVDLVSVVVVWLMNLVRTWPCEEDVADKGARGLGRSASQWPGLAGRES